MKKQYIVSFDQGTTSSRCIVYNAQMKEVSRGQLPFAQFFPNSGWVEHDPEEIWETSLSSFKQACKILGEVKDSIEAIGITNQRETTVVWDRRNGKAVYPAIVWQDRRTLSYCNELKSKGLEDRIRDKTGLPIDPYFSASKVRWILNSSEEIRQRAEEGHLCFGTIDSWLIWKLTQGKSHITDASNASRTMLFNLTTGSWDEELCKLFDIPMSMLPEVVDSSGDLAIAHPDVLGGAIPIRGIAGDQQAALYGHDAIEEGMLKNTYGTGCFMLMNTGDKILDPSSGILATVAWQINGKITYAAEGSVFNAGSAMTWLEDVNLIENVKETALSAEKSPHNPLLIFVPAFTGLGAPYWDSTARGLLIGLERNTSKEAIARAVLESIAYQNQDLLLAMKHASCLEPSALYVDGGMTANSFLMQFQSDLCQIAIHLPSNQEQTALGAAKLAAKPSNFFSENIERDSSLFSPSTLDYKEGYSQWKKAAQRAMHWTSTQD
ncbi:MAG: glycerol kinase GlpK [Bacteroidota bacterium]|nr:glycerol kinase GlpK [Bacteroidota bacterium]